MIIVDRFFVLLLIFFVCNSMFFEYRYADMLGTVYMAILLVLILLVKSICILFYNYKGLGFEKYVVFSEILIILLCMPDMNEPRYASYLYTILMPILLGVLFFHFFIWRGFIDKRYAIKNIRPSNVLYFIAGMDRDKDKDDLN